jgi:putative ATPase
MPGCSKVLGERMRRYDKGGEQFYDTISALHKSVRGSRPGCRAVLVLRACSMAAPSRVIWRDA